MGKTLKRGNTLIQIFECTATLSQQILCPDTCQNHFTAQASRTTGVGIIITAAGNTVIDLNSAKNNTTAPTTNFAKTYRTDKKSRTEHKGQNATPRRTFVLADATLPVVAFSHLQIN